MQLLNCRWQQAWKSRWKIFLPNLPRPVWWLANWSRQVYGEWLYAMEYNCAQCLPQGYTYQFWNICPNTKSGRSYTTEWDLQYIYEIPFFQCLTWTPRPVGIQVEINTWSCKRKVPRVEKVCRHSKQDRLDVRNGLHMSTWHFLIHHWWNVGDTLFTVIVWSGQISVSCCTCFLDNVCYQIMSLLQYNMKCSSWRTHVHGRGWCRAG